MVQTSNNADFQEHLHVINDVETGVNGIIAIHSTVLGPAAGGCRFWHYESQTDLTTDALRLARGMSYKNAPAGLPFGGGKAVLQHPTGDFDRNAFFRVFSDAVAELQGAYITAEDAGGTISVRAEYLDETSQQVSDRVNQIGERLLHILTRAAVEQRPPDVMADHMAQHMIARARKCEAA